MTEQQPQHTDPPPETDGDGAPRRAPRFRVSVAVILAMCTSVALAGVGALNRAAVDTQDAVAGATRLLEQDAPVEREGTSAEDQYGSPGLLAVCHDGRTLRVRESTLAILVSRGDEAGACS